MGRVIPFPRKGRPPTDPRGFLEDALRAFSDEIEAKLRADLIRLTEEIEGIERKRLATEDPMPASIPVQRTLKALRDEGWTADVAEKWIALPGKDRCHACGQPRPRPGFPPGIRRDLHGFVDVDAFHPTKGKLYVQASDDAGGIAKHVEKLSDPVIAEKIRDALRAGIRVEIHGWGMRGPRGGRKIWTRRRIKFVLIPTVDHGIVDAEAPLGPLPPGERCDKLGTYEAEGAP